MSKIYEQVKLTPELCKVLDKMHDVLIDNKVSVAEGMFVIMIMMAEGILEFSVDEQVTYMQVNRIIQSMRENADEDDSDSPQISLLN